MLDYEQSKHGGLKMNNTKCPHIASTTASHGLPFPTITAARQEKWLSQYYTRRSTVRSVLTAKTKMPIKPENKSRYPKNWKQIRERILQRADNRCEFCGVENHTYRYNPKTGKDAYIVLTIAHLDHTPENCSDDNLRALCQRCHNRYDAEHRKQTRKGNSATKQ